MKNVRRITGVFLITVLLLTAVMPFTILASEGEQLIYGDTFNEYGNDISNAIGDGKWHKFSAIADWNISISNGSVVIPQSENGLRYELSETLSNAKVKVEASIKAEAGAVGLFELVPEGNDSGLYAYRAVGDSTEGSVLRGQYGWSEEGANCWLVTQSGYNWYNVTAVIDIANGSYDLKVDDISGNNVAAKTGLATLMQGTSPHTNLPNLKYVQFRNWGSGNVYLDDFKISTIEDVEEPDEPVFDFMQEITENFDNIGDLGEAENFRESWYIDNGAPSLVVDGENKYLAVSMGQGIEWCFGEKIADSGKVKIKVSVKASDGSAGLIEMIPSDDALYERQGLFAMQFRSGAFGIQKYWDAPQIASGVVAEWYDVEYTLNFDNDTYGVQIFKDGKVFTQKRNIPMTMQQHGDALLPDLYSIRFRNFDQGIMYFDNLSVQCITEATDRDDIIFEESFENMAIDDMEKYGWYTTDDAAEVEQLDAEHKNSFKITQNSADLRKSFPEITEGKYKFKYSLYTEGDWTIAEALSTADWNKFLGLALFANGGKVYVSDSGGEDENYLLCTTASEMDWVTIENIIDMDTKTVTYITKDNAGNVCSKTIDKLVDAIDKTTPLTAFDMFRVINWRLSGPIYVDDVEFSYYNPAPEISRDSVSMVTLFGEVIEDIVNEVDPSVNKIVLNFGSAIGREEADSAINIVDEEGKTIDFESESDGEKIILTLTETLREKTDYVLTISDTLMGLNDKKIKEGFKFEFSTGKGAVMSRFAKVTTSGENVDKISDLTAGQILDVEVDFVNTEKAKAAVCLIIAYYNNNICEKTESVKIENIPLGTTEIDSMSFTVADMTDITEVRLFLWDSVGNMVPYDGAYVID